MAPLPVRRRRELVALLAEYLPLVLVASQRVTVRRRRASRQARLRFQPVVADHQEV